MTNDIILGIDTSNYTTSVAIIDSEKNLIANIKKPLPVKDGNIGLRQSDAVFAHIKNLPLAMDDAEKHIKGKRILAVGVSERPRYVEGSYMPCFLSGVAAAKSISVATGSPLYRFSHQCGHIMAAIYSSGSFDILDEEFAAFHISGGTSELMKVSGYEGVGFSAERVGGTKDLNIGQLIDRVGVHMGIEFPSGPKIEELALGYSGRVPSKKAYTDGMYANFSGIENYAKSLYEKCGDKACVSAFLLNYIADTITSMCHFYEESFGKTKFIFAGGVMSNSIIKDRLRVNFDARFAPPSMSTDNAVGIANLALMHYTREK